MINGLKTTTSVSSGGVIVSATINDNGHLLITLSNGQVIDAGAVRGPAGNAGDQGEKGDRGDIGPAGLNGAVGLTGAQGIQGPRGRDGQSFEIDKVGDESLRTDTVNGYAHEPEGFSYLQLDEVDVHDNQGNLLPKKEPLLFIKRSYGTNDWYPGVAFAKPIQGEKGDRGRQGEQGPIGLTGKQGAGLEPDARGLSDARSIYDAEDPGFIFYDYSPGKNVFYVKLSHDHGHWSDAYSMMKGDKGEKGDKGDTGNGIHIDLVIDQPFSSGDFENSPTGYSVYSTSDEQLHVKLVAGWSSGLSIKGEKGETGHGLRVDSAISNTIELNDYQYQRAPMGFMVMHTPSQTLFIKNYDYPWPGQDPLVDYSLPQYQDPEFKTKKQIWDSMTNSERMSFLWSSRAITMGEQGIQGIQGEKGDKGDQGEQGIQGLGFQPDFKGAGITPRRAYDNHPEGTSYLDITYGMLYFRQTNVKGQWGPAIPVSGSGGTIGAIEHIAHGELADPADPGNTVYAHNVLRITSLAHGSDAATTTSIFLSGTAHATFTFDEFNNQQTIRKFVTNVSYGAVIKPEFWLQELFRDAASLTPNVTFYVDITSNDQTRAIMLGSSKDVGGMDNTGEFEFNPFIVDSNAFDVLRVGDTNINVELRIAMSMTHVTTTYTRGQNNDVIATDTVENLGPLTGGVGRFLINIS